LRTHFQNKTKLSEEITVCSLNKALNLSIYNVRLGKISEKTAI